MASSPAAWAQQAVSLDRNDNASIKAWMTDWVKRMKAAKDEQEILQVRNDLIGYYDANLGGYNYVQQAAAQVAPLLQKDLGADPLRTLKEVNIALALSKLTQVTIQPALEVMVAHPNPAVKYYGWSGYAAERTPIAAMGPGPCKIMFSSLAKNIGTETNALILGQMLRVLDLESTRPDEITNAKEWEDMQQQTAAMLQANWKAWCIRVRNGDAEMIDALRNGVPAAGKQALWAKDKQPGKFLQMLVDAAWYAGQAYDDAKAVGRVGDAATWLLRDCEKWLNEAMGYKPGRVYIDRPLTDSRATDPSTVLQWIKSAEERYGVVMWVDDLKDKGVVQPAKIEKTTATSAPASQPAGS